MHPRHFRGRHHVAAISVVVALSLVGFRLFPAKEVTVLDSGTPLQVSGDLATTRDALAAVDITLQPGDRVIEGSGGRHVALAVQRAYPVEVQVDGKLLAVRSQASTIAGALADAGVELGPGDRVYLYDRYIAPRAPLRIGLYASAQAPAAGAATPQQISLRVDRARPVTLLLDSYRTETMSAAPTVGELLLDLGITVKEGDLVRPPLDAEVTAGTTVRLAKGKSVSVKYDGQDLTLYTIANTVADVVRLLGVTLGPDDRVSPGTDTTVVSGLAITVATTRVTEVEIEELFEPEAEIQYDATLANTAAPKVTPGKPGKKLVKYQILMKNGVEEKRVAVSETLVEPGIPTRKVFGTKSAGGAAPRATAAPSNPSSATGGTNGAGGRQMLVWATWYNLSHGAYPPGHPAYGTMKSGQKAFYGACAVDVSVIPLYTKFYVPGYGNCIALDTGGGVTGAHIDLFYPDDMGDPGWGAKWITITIYD